MSTPCAKPIYKYILSGLLSLLISAPVHAQTNKTGSSHAAKVGLLEVVRQTIAKNPNILFQKQTVEFNRGTLQTAGGEFDYFLDSSLFLENAFTPLSDASRTSFGVNKLENGTMTFDIGLTRKFRSGITAGPRVTITQSADRTFNLTTSASSVDFTVNVPLLRSAGVDVTGASETAALLEYEASKYDLKQIVSLSVQSSVIAYWNAVAALKNLEVLKSSVARAEDMLGKIKILIEAEERPAADIDQLLANLASKTTSQIRAEKSLLETKMALGFAMGLSVDEISSSPLPAENFPKLEEKTPRFTDNSSYLEKAIRLRFDIGAVKKRTERDKVLMVAAQKNMKSKLDFSLSMGYSGLEDRGGLGNYIGSLKSRVGGLNVAGLLSYELPVENNSLKGAYVQSAASYAQQEINHRNLARTIGAEVIVAISDLIRSVAELRKARESVKLHKRAVQREKLRQKAGVSTVIDLITQDDRLTAAFLTEVSAHLNYSVAIINLRFGTGTLIVEDQDRLKAGLLEIISAPSPN